MVIKDKFLFQDISRCLFDRISVNLGNTVVFFALFLEMVVFFNNFVTPRVFSLDSDFASEVVPFKPKQNLYCLVGIV